MPKALVLLSGGLDSMLAARALMEQGVEVVGVSFKSYFFNTEKAKKAAEQLGIKFIEIDFFEEHLAMVKNPVHGYGKNMNPCIDCHGMMLRHANKLLKDYNFIATGEVLGQRPMSQNREALKMVEKIAGLENKILRPLSAKLLYETEMEKEGLVNRGKLLDIKGRSRRGQAELAVKFGIKEYPAPAGGCLLTDPEFSQRLIKLFDNWPKCGGDDVEILKNGRVIWMNMEQRGQDADKTRNRTRNNAEKSPLPLFNKGGSKVLVVVGRNKEECENLEKLAKKGDIVIELKEMVGPLTVVRIFNFQFSIFNEREIELKIPRELKMSELRLGEEKSEEEIFKIVGLLTGFYATKARGKRVKLEVRSKK